MASEAERAAQRGIQSIEVGGALLRALVHQGGPMALKDLAREAEMTPAKAHPYLVSFGRLGLIEQDRSSGHYRLGPLSLQLGLISLQQADPIHVATPLLAGLAQEIGQTVAIAVWGDRGATIVRVVESPAPLHVVMRHGTVFSMTNTASGRLFAAYLEAGEVRRMLEDEGRRRQATPAPVRQGMPPQPPLPGWKAFQAQLREVRLEGLSRSEGEILPGVNAMAAPIFDHTATMVLALIAIGPAAILDSRFDGPVGQGLRACAARISAQLGAAGQAVQAVQAAKAVNAAA